MSEIIQAIILGIVQGLTEFLPISSSGHLIVLPRLFDWRDFGLSFDVALHLGTLFAILIYFRKEWIRLVKAFFQSLVRPKQDDFYQKLSHFLLLGSVPAILVGFFLENKVETLLRSPLIVALTLMVFAIFLYLADTFGKKRKEIGAITIWQVFLIGVAQAISIVPGVSRSGVTITAGLIFGLSRQEAARFSFLLSAPIIFGAGLFEALSLEASGIDFCFLAGIIASMLVGIGAIWFLLRYVMQRSYNLFVVYRIILGVLILILFFNR